MKKLLISLAPLLAVAAFALLPSAAMAGTEPCRVITAGTASPGVEGKVCNNPPGAVATQNIRENKDTPEMFPTDALAVNTAGGLRLLADKKALSNSNPIGYAFFGLKFETNPLSKKAECKKTEGSIPFVDIQNASPSAVFQGKGSWKFSITSDSTACAEAERGKVTISEVSLLFETLNGGGPVTATGTITGKYSQPSATEGKCPNGGVELNIAQPGIVTVPATTEDELDNTLGKAAFICFVSANNYVFPETEAPKWKASKLKFFKD